MRSKLFVPGARPELFDKALAGAADALSFDLEDAVAHEAKPAAREAIAAFVRGDAARAAAKVLIVRINAPGTPWFADDLAAFAGSGIALLNLPKAESGAGVRDAVAALVAAEQAAGVDPDLGPRLLANIESPAGLARAAEIAGADPRVAGLQLGLGDLFEPHGVDRRDPRNVHAAMFAVRMAAAQAGVFALDGAWPAIDDADGFRAEAAMARALGFLGKSCIHPRQVALANDAFAPDADALAWARRVVDAAAAQPAGTGAFRLDGRMVDLPFLKRAQALVAAHG